MLFLLVKSRLFNNSFIIKMSIEIESAELVVYIVIIITFLFFLSILIKYILKFHYSVIRLIQQYLKESNLMKSLQTLQVIISYFPIYITELGITKRAHI